MTGKEIKETYNSFKIPVNLKQYINQQKNNTSWQNQIN